MIHHTPSWYRVHKPVRHQPEWYHVRAPNRQHTNDMGYAMRGVTDMSKMAVTGMVGVGMLGAIGSALKK